MISFYILSMYRFETTFECLRSIKENVQTDYEVILFENGSAEGEDKKAFENLENEWKELKVIYHDEHITCPQARSKVMEYANGDYIFFVDNDCIFESDVTQPLVDILQADEELGGASTVLLQWPSRKIHCCGIDIEMKDGDLFHPKHLYYEDEYSKVENLEPFQCDFIPGGCSLFKRELLEKFSYDPEFKNAFGDYDFCMSGRKEGYKFAVHPGHYLVHTRDQNDKRYTEVKAGLTDRVGSWLKFKEKWDLMYYVYPEYLKGNVKI